MPDPQLDRIWERFAWGCGLVMTAIIGVVAFFVRGCQ